MSHNDLFSKFGNDTKNTWRVIYKILCSNRNTELSNEFIIDGIKETNNKIIANTFAKQYSELGKIYAKKIDESVTESVKKIWYLK